LKRLVETVFFGAETKAKVKTGKEERDWGWKYLSESGVAPPSKKSVEGGEGAGFARSNNVTAGHLYSRLFVADVAVFSCF